MQLRCYQLVCGTNWTASNLVGVQTSQSASMPRLNFGAANLDVQATVHPYDLKTGRLHKARSSHSMYVASAPSSRLHYYARGQQRPVRTFASKLSECAWPWVPKAFMNCHRLLKAVIASEALLCQLCISCAGVEIVYVLRSLVRITAGANCMPHPFQACKLHFHPFNNWKVRVDAPSIGALQQCKHQLIAGL